MQSIIPEGRVKDKQPGAGWLGSLAIVLILVLVAVTAFGLGRLSAQDSGQQGSLIIHDAPQTTP